MVCCVCCTHIETHDDQVIDLDIDDDLDGRPIDEPIPHADDPALVEQQLMNVLEEIQQSLGAKK